LLVDTYWRGEASYDFHVVACGACGFVYVTPRGIGEMFDNLAGGGARRDADRANRPIYQRGLARLMAAGLPSDGRILDLGCATGDFLAYATAAGFRPTGVDLNPGLAKKSMDRGFDVHCGDLRELNLPAEFDAVTLWDVIEHVDDPVGVLRACRQVLRPGGLVFFHTGNARFQIPKARILNALRPQGGPYLIPYQHVSHFDPVTALTVLEGAGFEPLEVFFAATLHYRRWWKRLAMGTVNRLGQVSAAVGGPLLTNSMGAIGRCAAAADSAGYSPSG
jgi:SAM-dependent methyltransferase